MFFSFKKPNNAQGSQTRVVNSDIRNDATAGCNIAVSGSARGVQNGAHSQSHGIERSFVWRILIVYVFECGLMVKYGFFIVLVVGGSDAPVVKQNVMPAPKVNRGVPKAPAPNSTPISSNTMAPSTPAKG